MVKQEGFLFMLMTIVDAIYKIMHSEAQSAINIGPLEDISINDLVKLVGKISNKKKIKHVDGPVGVQARKFSKGKITSLG